MHKGQFKWRWGTPDRLGNTCGGSPHPSCKRDQFKMRDFWYMEIGRLPHLFKARYLAYLVFTRPPCKQVLYMSYQAKFEFICYWFVQTSWSPSPSWYCVKLNSMKGFIIVTRINMREVRSSRS